MRHISSKAMYIVLIILLLCLQPVLGEILIDLNKKPVNLTIYGGGSGYYLGDCLAHGDFNGDGVQDLLAPYQRPASKGGAFIIYGNNSLQGSIDLANFTADVLIYSADEDDGKPDSCAAGDMNNDGYDDMILGDYYATYPNSAISVGLVYVIYGGPALSSLINLNVTPANLTIYGRNTTQHIGSAVCSSDLNGDGHDDIVTADYLADITSRSDAGKVQVILGGNFSNDVIYLNRTDANMTILGQAAQDSLGYALACGDVNGDSFSELIIGANNADPPSRGDGGKAYVFFGKPVLPQLIDLSTGQANITLYGAAGDDSLGKYIEIEDMNNDTIADMIIDAYGADGGGRDASGKVYVIYGRTAFPSLIDLQTYTANRTIYGQIEGDRLGTPLGIGDINEDGHADLVMGAKYADNGLLTDAGKVFVSFGSGSQSQVLDLNATPANITFLGDWQSVNYPESMQVFDFDGDGTEDIIMGGSSKSPYGRSYAGEIYVISGRPTAQFSSTYDFDRSIANLTVIGNESSDSSGSGVAAGDVNGDGIEDLIIGAMYAGFPTKVQAGEVYVYFGSAGLAGQFDRPPYNANITLYGENAEDHAYIVHSADLNNDSIDDIIIASYSADALGRTETGKVQVILGRQSFPSAIQLGSATVNLTIYGENQSDYLGMALSSGDINDDGIADLIIGTQYPDTIGGSNAGAAYVILGDNKLPATIDLDAKPANMTVYGTRANSYLGYSVSACDVNGDSFDDLILGESGLNSDRGATRVLWGRRTLQRVINLNQTAANVSVLGKNQTDQVGRTVSCGDINDDGFDDMIIGARFVDSQNKFNSGATLIIYGSASLSGTIDLNQTSAGFTVYGAATNDESGTSVHSGDVDGDGFADMIIGAPAADPSGGSASGETYVVFGSDELAATLDLNTSSHLRIAGQNKDDNMGFLVASGDINGDGRDDVILGTPSAHAGAGNLHGRTYAVYGSSGFNLGAWSPPIQTENDAGTDLDTYNRTSIKSVPGYIWQRNNLARIDFGAVNLSGVRNLDAVIEVGNRFAFVNSSSYRNLNKSAQITFYGIDCTDERDLRIYYSEAGYTRDEIIAQGTLCAAGCSSLTCVGGANGNLTFTVSHFTGYASGVNANLTIYDEIEAAGTKYPGDDVTFFANYTNAGSHISGASCNISFDDAPGTWFAMADTGANYNYTKAGGFGAIGSHTWNVTCVHASYSQLDTTDTIEITSAASVPEFSGLAVLLALLIVVLGIVKIHRKAQIPYKMIDA